MVKPIRRRSPSTAFSSLDRHSTQPTGDDDGTANNTPLLAEDIARDETVRGQAEARKMDLNAEEEEKGNFHERNFIINGNLLGLTGLERNITNFQLIREERPFLCLLNGFSANKNKKLG